MPRAPSRCRYISRGCPESPIGTEPRRHTWMGPCRLLAAAPPAAAWSAEGVTEVPAAERLDGHVDRHGDRYDDPGRAEPLRTGEARDFTCPDVAEHGAG